MTFPVTVKSLDFSTLPEKLLVSIIQNDDLQMDEVEIWKHVLKWGLAQNPGLSSDPSNCSKDDFNVLKNTLQQCIPFVRFYNFAPKEFLDKEKNFTQGIIYGFIKSFYRS